MFVSQKTVTLSKMSNELVFLMIRHVETETHNNLWIECYKSIRKYYPTVPIKIIDNNSKADKIKFDFILINCDIITSEFPETRLFSPFYEFLKMTYKKAIIIHDGIVFNKFIDFTSFNLIKFIWHFETHAYDNYTLEMNQLKKLENSEELIPIYSNKKWFGCMGCLTVIDRDCINIFESKYKISNLCSLIKNQADAIAFERTLAVLAYAVNPEIQTNTSYFGDIKNLIWGYRYETYIANPLEFSDKPVIKLFAARK